MVKTLQRPQAHDFLEGEGGNLFLASSRGLLKLKWNCDQNKYTELSRREYEKIHTASYSQHDKYAFKNE